MLCTSRAEVSSTQLRGLATDSLTDFGVLSGGPPTWVRLPLPLGEVAAVAANLGEVAAGEVAAAAGEVAVSQLRAA